MTTETMFVDDNNNIITNVTVPLPMNVEVIKTKATKTKAPKAKAAAPVTAPVSTKRGKKGNKMVEIVAMAKEKGYEPVLTGKCLKTLPCRKCGKKAVLFSNGVKKILACTCGYREGR